jgi:hypothetical protein
VDTKPPIKKMIPCKCDIKNMIYFRKPNFILRSTWVPLTINKKNLFLISKIWEVGLVNVRGVAA